MEQPLAASAVAEHAAHCHGSLQTRVTHEGCSFHTKSPIHQPGQRDSALHAVEGNKFHEQEDPLPDPDEHELDKYYKAEDTELDSTTTTDRRLQSYQNGQKTEGSNRTERTP
ncbi:hypothetical protein M513_12976 [Trichuris suis]|uniref:Uncharacterized protein n=1 Tax=Trichuris suis TaxID=68888 RepID=A0A085LMD8_9BILA|nr:hypothetical protein M513_12976 [Trichuris suis]